MPWDFRRLSSGVRCTAKERRGPEEAGAAPGPARIGAPLVRLFLVRLRPRRAELRFTGQPQATKKGDSWQ